MGTTFIISLPCGKDHLKKDEIVYTTDKIPPYQSEIEEDIILPESSATEQPEPTLPSGRYPTSRLISPILLLVEDNTDMRNYMRNCLELNYRTIEAKDGYDGFKKATNKIPDLVISDVMMPKMDGYELCKKLKTDKRTSHISIILLTARAETIDKIEGLETGADEYLTKPFDTKELHVRVKNLINQRRLLRKKFSKQETFNPEEIAASPIDSIFLKRAKNIIENSLSDTDFSIERFAEDIGLSRSQLHRKMRALTDHSPTEFIRILRLQYALKLFTQDRTIAEIAYEVGFNNPAYFSQCFRKQYGKLPSEFTQSIKD